MTGSILSIKNARLQYIKYSESKINEFGKKRITNAKNKFNSGPHKEAMISDLQDSCVVFPIDAEIPKGRISIVIIDAL